MIGSIYNSKIRLFRSQWNSSVSVASKLHTAIVLSLLSCAHEGPTCESKAGFRSVRSCIDDKLPEMRVLKYRYIFRRSKVSVFHDRNRNSSQSIIQSRGIACEYRVRQRISFQFSNHLIRLTEAEFVFWSIFNSSLLQEGNFFRMPLSRLSHWFFDEDGNGNHTNLIDIRSNNTLYDL